MTFGVTVDGFVTKRLDDIKTEIEDALKIAFGPGVNLTSESPFGQIVGILAEREASLWELAEGVYNSQYPDTAEGVPLDNAVALTGITRRAATFSTVTATFTGDPGTVIPAGFAVTVDGNPNARFLLDDEQTIPGGGEVDGSMTADTAGEILAPSGSLTVIETPLVGLDSVTNDLDADSGEEIETDSELKLRRTQSLRRAGAGTVEAIRADILEVDEVTQCSVLENVTDVTDVDGLPPHSFSAVVRGGDDTAIAQAIWESKPAGIETYGSETVTITDTQGFDHDISFARPEELEIWVELDLTTDADVYPVNGDDLVKAALVEFGDNLTLGEDVIVYPKLIAALNDIPGIEDITVRIGTAASPTLDDNIPVSALQIAAFDTSRITVNS